MKKSHLVALLLSSFFILAPNPLVLAAPQKVEKTSLEIQAIQSREFEADKKIAFAATLSVFQDLGYIIDSASIETGFITAQSPSKLNPGIFSDTNNQSRVTAYVDEYIPGKCKVRLNFVNGIEKNYGSGFTRKKEMVVEDPVIYQNAFTKIQESVFIRTTMNEKPKPAAEAAPTEALKTSETPDYLKKYAE